MSALSLWWDDAAGSTHLHPAPFYSEEDAAGAARHFGARSWVTQQVGADEFPFFFPSHKQH